MAGRLGCVSVRSRAGSENERKGFSNAIRPGRTVRRPDRRPTVERASTFDRSGEIAAEG
ncbi:hypothetical protein [Halovivax gelatinilyticus]|uniref:hypothetical protein n=1 Tax=Halovivax gelatinilyticus TaxID=2961597 RepID=UPI0020CA5C52|nr:hypothetical protein [Halovivax gelatinilyticus]